MSITLLKHLVSRRWILATLLVLLAMGVMLRLAVWQVDRLQERRALNAELLQVLEANSLMLTGDMVTADPAQLRDRRVTAVGHFDLTEQISLKVQNWEGRAGIHLVAPLVLDGETAVLVDRGWIPDAQAAPEYWSIYDEPGQVTIDGYAALSQIISRATNSSAPTGPQQEWYRIDIAAIQPQIPYALLPIYLLQAPPETEPQELPYRSMPTFDLSEGPHLGYAIQWVLFTLVLGVGYLYYVQRHSAPAAAA